MSDNIADLVARLEEEAERLSGHSIDRGSIDAGISSNLATEAAQALTRIAGERDRNLEDADGYKASMKRYFSDKLAAESQRDQLAEALRKIDRAWENATRGHGDPERDLGWTGSRDNYGQMMAWVARAALASMEKKP